MKQFFIFLIYTHRLVILLEIFLYFGVPLLIYSKIVVFT